MSEDRRMESRGQGGRGRGPREGGGDRFGGGDRGRGRRGEPRGPTGFEAVALGFARDIDKPIVKQDYEAQLEPIEKFVLATRKGGKTRSLDELQEASRGKLFTALLRVMRQRPVEDEEKEAQRKKVFATLSEAWRALGDDRRAQMLQEEAGDAQPAPFLLAHTGEWDKVAALHEKERRYAEAAALFEEHGKPEEAARLYKLAGNVSKMVELLVASGDREAVIELAKGLEPARREEALLAAGMGDVLMDLLVQEERWDDVARLYERADQFLDAARCWEKADKTHKAIRAFDRADQREEADRLIGAEAAQAEGEGGPRAAAKVWARFGRMERATELTPDPLEKSRWLREAGKEEEARAVAKEQLDAATAEGKTPLDLAPWIARSGDTASALKIWDEHREPRRAASVMEELGEWELAARCLEVAGEFLKAGDHFEKAGNAAEAERVRALAPPPPPPPSKPKGGRPEQRRRGGGGGGGGRRPGPKGRG